MEPGQFMASQRQADMLDAVAIAVQRWPIVGRRSELEVFERALYSGRHAGLVIYGQPGVGKTRLADECRELAAADGHPTERVAGSRTTALLPLGAVASLLAAGLVACRCLVLVCLVGRLVAADLPFPSASQDTHGLAEEAAGHLDRSRS